MRGTHGIATHLAQHSKPEPLQRIRHSRPDTRMILMIACALNLHGLSVQEESFVRRELRRAHAKAHALGIARLARRVDGNDRLVEIWLLH